MRVNNCVFSIISLKSNDFSSLTEMYGQLVNLKNYSTIIKIVTDDIDRSSNNFSRKRKKAN